MTYESILHVIGKTPLVRVPFDVPARAYAMLEYLNPGGSIKDRAAAFMIEEAERTGKLKPGGTIIEASSGNQGTSAAFIGAIKGYKVIITVSEKVSQEKKQTLMAYGAQIVICKPVDDFNDPEGYYETARRLHQETPGSYFLEQYFNRDNFRAHYYGLGPDIWNKTHGEITHFIAGVGSGGTIGGAAKYLKERNPAIKVIGVDVAGSWLATKGKPQPYKIEGIGVDYDSPHVRSSLENKFIDEIINVSDADAFAMLKTLARKHGILVGPASGAVAHGMYHYAKKLKSTDLIVTSFGDSGRAYLTKGYYDL